MFSYFSEKAANEQVAPLVVGLLRALYQIEGASPGYARMMIDRIASIKGVGTPQYEALHQILGEIYVTAGAIDYADCDDEGSKLFSHEPGGGQTKNPEFEVCSNGRWYAVEVKTPSLCKHVNDRQSKSFQLTARLPGEATDKLSKTLPRDNPVKDFLISANAKFSDYSKVRPDAYRILTIIWDDFCNEPISALLNKNSGLLTDQSFYKDKNGDAVKFPYIDGVIVCRYLHQIVYATWEEPLIDDEMLPMVYRNLGFPPKVLIANPSGRKVPNDLLEPLNAIPYDPSLGAEYAPSDLVMWVGRRDQADEE